MKNTLTMRRCGLSSRSVQAHLVLLWKRIAGLTADPQPAARPAPPADNLLCRHSFILQVLAVKGGVA